MTSLEHTLILRPWQTLIEHETKTVPPFDTIATKAIIRSETVFGVRYLLVSRLGDEQKIQVTSTKLFLVERRYATLEMFDY